MSNDKEIMRKLLAIAEKQQKVITKLAQMAAPPPPDTLEPSKTVKNEAAVILGALAPVVRAAIDVLEVHDTEVRVRFVKGKGTNEIFAALQKTIQDLQARNALPGKAYTIREVL